MESLKDLFISHCRKHQNEQIVDFEAELELTTKLFEDFLTRVENPHKCAVEECDSEWIADRVSLYCRMHTCGYSNCSELVGDHLYCIKHKCRVCEEHVNDQYRDMKYCDEHGRICGFLNGNDRCTKELT